jgi:hypothetical protein
MFLQIARPAALIAISLLYALPASAEMHLFFLANEKDSNNAPELAFVNMKDYQVHQCLAAVENLAASAEKQGIDFVDGRCVNTFYKFSQPSEAMNYVYLLKYLGGAPTLKLMDSVSDCFTAMTDEDEGEAFCGRSSQRIVYP